MSQVFISYQREDIAFAHDIRFRLQAAGITPWLDELIEVGQVWRQAIDDALRDSFALIVVITPESMLSEYVTYEWSFAVGRGLPVIPLLYKPTDNIHPRLEVLNFLDFTSADKPWDRLFERLRELQDTPLQASDTPRPDLSIINPVVEHADAVSAANFAAVSDLYENAGNLRVTPMMLIDTLWRDRLLSLQNRLNLLDLEAANRQESHGS